jgi:hypothetical protein
MNLDLQDEYGNTLIIHLLYRTRVYREDFRVINQQYGVEGINDFSHTAKVIEYLLDHEVELSLQNQHGQIAAHYIPYIFFNDPDMHVNIIRIIQLSPHTKKHAENNNDPDGGNTPLMEFANIPQELIGLSDNTMIEIAQLFLDAGANPMERNDQGHTASEVAFEQDNNALGQFLQQKEREYQHEAQGALVSRMRGREGANRMPLAVGRRITEFLGGRKRTHKQKNKRLKRRSRKHRRPLRH